MVLITLSCTVITHTAPLGPNPTFVEILCSHTPHPKKCNHFLLKRNAEFKKNAHIVALTYLGVNENETILAKKNVAISRFERTIKYQEHRAVILFVKSLDDCNGQLTTAYLMPRNLSSTSTDFKLRRNKIDESIKGALGHVSTCIKQFVPPDMNGKIKDVVVGNVTNVEDLIRNSMTLVYICYSYLGNLR